MMRRYAWKFFYELCNLVHISDISYGIEITS